MLFIGKSRISESFASIRINSLIKNLSIFVCIIYSLFLINVNFVVKANDNPSGNLDMNALANMASNLGAGNQQIMNAMTSMFNLNQQQQQQQTNENQQQGQQAGVGVKRRTRFGTQDSINKPTSQPISKNHLSSMMSMIPGLSSFLNNQAKHQTTTTASPVTTTPQPSVSNPLMLAGFNLMPLATSLMDLTRFQSPFSFRFFTNTTPKPINNNNDQSIQADTNKNGATPVVKQTAQQVINQILTAYAKGQIPNEMVQLSLSGRVPPQIIELSLSGQVPPQVIQMVITGKVPMETINAFLDAMTSTENKSASNSTQIFPGAQLLSQVSTKYIFESLFGKNRNKDSTLMVPTLLGAVPVQIPSIPTLSNVKKFGQIIGNTISNVAAMFPFSNYASSN